MNASSVFLFAAALILATSLHAFSPPADTQQGVTLSIAGVAQKVAAECPLAFTVQLTNASSRAVSGTVSVQMNDDWQVTGTTDFAVTVAPVWSVSVRST